MYGAKSAKKHNQINKPDIIPEHILTARGDIHSTTHRPSLPYQDIPRFMATLRAWEDTSYRRWGHAAG
jgi:hypothetical protein